MELYGIIGYPLNHTLSPQIHSLAFSHLRYKAKYRVIEIHPRSFSKKITLLRQEGLQGLNVTIPFKEKVIPVLDHIDDKARMAGAVNTIQIKDGLWIGYNTDIDGFLQPLRKRAVTAREHCLVLGNGGAARAVITALLAYGETKRITIAARHIKKSQDLIATFSLFAPDCILETCLLDLVPVDLSEYDMVINATPVGMGTLSGKSPLPAFERLRDGSVVYDLIYNPEKTQLLKQAAKYGSDLILLNGFEMLISQAAGSFKIWTGKKLPVDTVIKHLTSV